MFKKMKSFIILETENKVEYLQRSRFKQPLQSGFNFFYFFTKLLKTKSSFCVPNEPMKLFRIYKIILTS